MKKHIFIGILIFLILTLQRSGFASDEKAKPEHAYNQGIDFYNKLDYNKASDSFQKAFNTEKSKLEQWTNYNLGNAVFQQAQKLQETDLQRSQAEYKKALDLFKRAIDLDKDDVNAKYNYEVTATKIQEVQKQQQKQQKQEQQEKQAQDKKDQQQQQQKQEQQENQDQDKKDQQQQKNSQLKSEEMTEEQAKMLLENFENSEDRPVQVRKHDKKNQSVQTDKDW